ncbi:MAG TPA: cupredoxin domain-containing protein [bacterium]|jgi:plastocyanin|nr:cupredoxin domain-containing protein [bacterium]
MKTRWITIGLAAAALLLSLAPALPVAAQAKRTIRIVATSYKFEPSLVQVRQGETVVLELVNADTEGRNHSLAAELFEKANATSRGDVARTGSFEGRRFFAAAPGKQLEVEFVASERGSFAFFCGISNHAAMGQVGAINVLPPSP